MGLGSRGLGFRGLGFRAVWSEAASRTELGLNRFRLMARATGELLPNLSDAHEIVSGSHRSGFSLYTGC